MIYFPYVAILENEEVKRNYVTSPSRPVKKNPTKTRSRDFSTPASFIDGTERMDGWIACWVGGFLFFFCSSSTDIPDWLDRYERAPRFVSFRCVRFSHSQVQADHHLLPPSFDSFIHSSSRFVILRRFPSLSHKVRSHLGCSGMTCFLAW